MWRDNAPLRSHRLSKTKAVLGVRYCCAAVHREGSREPQTVHDIAVALGYPLERHGETLLLNIPHFGHRTQRNQAGIDLEDSSLMASSYGARCSAGCCSGKGISGLTRLLTLSTTAWKDKSNGTVVVWMQPTTFFYS